ncbi:MAG: type II toxin-antitoxin system RelE/ParE family toxin [Pseudomonadota bacterium]|nr:type II toxin-antitoxin system RelE/ParE family toxin [Pseudomonadota bacterium]
MNTCHVLKKGLRIQLTALNSAIQPEDIDASGWQFHPLKRDMKDVYTVSVNGNWRLTFRFEGENAYLTLKQETTRPPGQNLLQQQAKFEDFIHEYSFERPHQALGMKCPGEFYRL